jgi:hypothetical protein
MGSPFAVFYNPSLLGSNPGYTFGLDTKLDSANYDFRGALTIPVSKVMRRENLFKENSNRYFRYANQSYRSSMSAVSIGGIYAGEDNYQLSAGFAAPIYLVQSGLSFDFLYRGEEAIGGVNLMFSADMPRYMRGRMLYAGFNNLIVSDRDGTNDMSILIGTAGILEGNDSRVLFMPYDLSLVSYIKNGSISHVEGTARINLDLTAVHTSRETFGQLPSAAAGYTLIRKKGGAVSHKIFVNLGISFINRSSSAGLLGSYGKASEYDEQHLAFFYSTFKRGEVIGTDGDIIAGLSYGDAGDGKWFFALTSAGTTVRSWVLRIENSRGGSVKTYSGGNVVPSTILWDGLTGDGNAVEDQVVFVKLVLNGDSRVVESNSVGIELENRANTPKTE